MKYALSLFMILLFLGSCTSESSVSSTNSDSETSTETPKEITSDTSKTETTVTTKKAPARLGTAPVRLASQEKLDKMHENLMNQMETGFATKDVIAYAKEAELYMSIYGDSLAAEHLFNAADLYRGIGDYTKALDTWYIVYRSYDRDGHPKAPHAMFQCGFTYDSVLNKKDLAKTLYNMFLKRYPDHTLAKDAKLLLANLDKSPEDLIKEFQKKNKQ
ncbi:MAG: tol-pal system YbgF family protein [Saprospiraceae bacterium]